MNYHKISKILPSLQKKGNTKSQSCHCYFLALSNLAGLKEQRMVIEKQIQQLKMHQFQYKMCCSEKNTHTPYFYSNME